MKTSSPLKLMEYVSRDKPIIATRLENFINDFADYDRLFFMKDNTPESMAYSIDKYILNFKIDEEVNSQGKNIIKRKFTWEIQAKKIDSFLESFYRNE